MSVLVCTMYVLQYYELKCMFYAYTLFISGIWASLETILFLLCSIATPKFILMMYLVHGQDTVLVGPPYPYFIKEDRIDLPLEDYWYA